MCTFCQAQNEDLLHFFIQCTTTNNIWKRVKKFISNEFDTYMQLNFSPMNILFNIVHPHLNHIINLFVLIVKQCLYRNRCLNEKPNFKCIQKEFIHVRSMEFYYSKTKNKLKYFCKKWAPYTTYPVDSMADNIPFENVDDFIDNYVHLV